MEMEIKKAEFIISAVKKGQYPEDGRPEVAFVGRSNVGKSTLINTLTNRRKLVKVSSTPGKTRLINFFVINDNMYFVDLPGYGYAKVSKREKENWGYIMEQYLVERDQLKKIVLLVDSRHKPTSDDINMYNWIKHYNYEVLVVGTKLDKLKRNDINKNKKIIRDTLKMDKDDKILLISSLSKEGKEEVLEQILVY
ncbi:YihA family ribosome biogenesis GTP-binding protein [Clostridium botulinum]|uniref:Probable GTP-binding protein EngB n=2 Tax=Clostridium botulinum TaxID=1491 RepID=A0A846J8N1_CLOBO|nr:GTP-binding protein [Clostridium botulinum A3 str. Loch Maree]NFH66619.1 YihA family ribosome biogenesis GTP-binding protein [Clostridium botulinum]NFJ10466.1 YihA family ribosome biogenesis GTP-binding protein [Clostridium botulinum]NFK16935.1 YihA family ribosome biogenesis GTP-binding protein [Clostridium botulinum]NFM94739.1 YihA family ribosome biogenesis GTP-binding protein [Clostridium botulinum]